jgi:Flp pilus assembly pilin Flp
MLKLFVKAQRWREVLKDECGQDSVEYAILIGIVATGVIGSVSTISSYVTTTFSTLASSL